MALLRWEPAPHVMLPAEMHTLLSALLAPATGSPAPRVPAMDVTERDEEYVLELDLPGVPEADVAIELDERTLTISGERPAAPDDHAVRRERPTGAFRRTVTLPAGVTADGVTASFADGVLSITVAKPAEPQPHRIQIGTHPALATA